MCRRIIAVLAALWLVSCTTAPKTREECYAEGVRLLREQNPGAALVYFKNALEKDQNYTDARFQLALAYSALGKHEASEKELRKVQLQRPRDPEVLRELARSCVFNQKPDEALKILGGLPEKETKAAEALEISGWAYAQKGDYSAAADRLEKAVARRPDSTGTLSMLARVYLYQKKTAAAGVKVREGLALEPSNGELLHLLARVQELEKDPKAALETYDRITAEAPGDSTGFFLKGMLLLRMKRSEEALETAAMLIETFPGSHEGFRLKGMALFYRKNFADAVNALQKSLALKPDAETCYFLGLSHFYSNELEQALNQMQRALTVNPGLTQPRVIAALIYLKKDKFDEAIREINKVLAVEDRNPAVHSILGSAFLAKGMTGEGIAELDRAIELDPGLVEARVRKGMFELSRGRDTEAESQLTAAVRSDPDLVNTRVLLAAYYLKRNESGKAIATAEQGLRNRKADAVLLNIIADARLQQKKTEAAMRALEKARAADPGYAATYFKTAVLLQLQGDQEKAAALLQDFARRKPGNIQAQLAAAAQLELAGNAREAGYFFEQARRPGSAEGDLEAARHYLRRGDPDRALTVLDEAIRKNPFVPDLYALKGRVSLDRNQPAEALEAFEELTKHDLQAGISGIISAHLAADRPEQALDRVQREMKTNPGRPELHAEVSRIYAKMGRLREAEDQAKQIIRSMPGSGLGYLTLAAVNESAGQIDRAIAVLDRAVSLPDPRIGLMLGGLHEGTGNYSAALAAFESAEALPGAAVPALFRRASLLQTLGSRSDAIAAYTRLLTLSPGHVGALNNLARLYAQEKDTYPLALLHAAQALMRSPLDGAVQDTLGFILVKGGRIREGLRVLRRAEEALPDDPSVNFHLAVGYSEEQDRTAALFHLEKSLRPGDFPEKATAKKLHGQLSKQGAGMR